MKSLLLLTLAAALTQSRALELSDIEKALGDADLTGKLAGLFKRASHTSHASDKQAEPQFAARSDSDERPEHPLHRLLGTSLLDLGISNEQKTSTLEDTQQARDSDDASNLVNDILQQASHKADQQAQEMQILQQVSETAAATIKEEEERKQNALHKARDSQSQMMTELVKDMRAVMKIVKTLSSHEEEVESQLARIQQTQETLANETTSMQVEIKAAKDAQEEQAAALEKTKSEVEEAGVMANDAKKVAVQELGHLEQTQTQIRQVTNEVQMAEQATGSISQVLEQLASAMTPSQVQDSAAAQRRSLQIRR